MLKAFILLADRRRRSSEEGASAVEYGLLVALIAAVIVLAVWGIGTLVQDSLGDTCGDIATRSGSAAAGDAECTSD